MKHSASPAMQNAGITSLGLNWRYLAFDVPPESLRETIAGAKAMGFIGLNLTVPHKLLAVEMVDVLDESAKVWGAVNTVRFETKNRAGHWVPLGLVEADEVNEVRSHGFNTDADAIVRAVEEDLRCTIKGARILVLGAGGAGRVAALRFAAEGAAELFLINRTQSKSEVLAVEIGQRNPQVKTSTAYPNSEVDLVINCTSLGLKDGDALSFDEKQFSLKQTKAAYDMIYRPAKTPFLNLAEKTGKQTANGLGMLLYQGAKALEIWTGKPAPIGEMRRGLEANVYGK